MAAKIHEIYCDVHPVADRVRKSLVACRGMGATSMKEKHKSGGRIWHKGIESQVGTIRRLKKFWRSGLARFYGIKGKWSPIVAIILAGE
tara:strand:+ start:36006 stop:36272 length:267 start_codon:yes stop_codon:yes gene_type:complete